MDRSSVEAFRGERGVALLMALLVLLVISLLAASMLVAINVETKIAGHGLRENQALQVAEAGISEATARVRNFDIPSDGANPRMVSQIFLAAPGSVPGVTGDTIGLATAQPGGAWLNYSTAGRGPDVLTVTYKTDTARTVVYRYDPSKTPPVNTTSGNPIFQVRSTGRQGVDKRTIVTEFIQRPINFKVNAALTANVNIRFNGTADVCGYNHVANTPTYTVPPACNAGVNSWLAPDYLTTSLPGGWSTGDIDRQGAAQCLGYPPGTPANETWSETQTGFYEGPWSVLNVSQAEWWQWVGPSTSSPPLSPNGIIHLDNNGITQDQSGAWHFDGGTGEGMIYADGDLTINGDFVYRGMLYLEGDLHINGNCWILGGVICKGQTEIKVATGTAHILYSRDAIAQALARYGGTFVNLSWREIPN